MDMGLSESCEEGFKHLLEYIKRHGDARVPHSYVAEKHRLGGWVRKQRSRNARRTLDPDRKRRLEMLPGWIWDTNVDQWEDGYVRASWSMSIATATLAYHGRTKLTAIDSGLG